MLTTKHSLKFILMRLLFIMSLLFIFYMSCSPEPLDEIDDRDLYPEKLFPSLPSSASGEE